ncbi:hypothetical protein D3C78_1346950 [compost metagenome]
MRHHSYDIACFVADSRNIIYRAVRVRIARITEHDLVVRFKLRKRSIITVVIAFAVRDWNIYNFALRILVCKRSAAVYHFKLRLMTAELQSVVANQSAWQETSFRQNLKSVANAENVLACFCRFLHLIHNLCKLSNSSAAQIVAIREAARHKNCIISGKISRCMPYVVNLLSDRVLNRLVAIDIAVGPRKYEYRKLHRLSPPVQNGNLLRPCSRTASRTSP